MTYMVGGIPMENREAVIEQIMSDAATKEGRRKSRLLTAEQAEIAVRVGESKRYKSWTVYAGDWVAKSYGYFAPMTCVRGYIAVTGTISLDVMVTDAKRHRGQGPSVTGAKVDQDGYREIPRYVYADEEDLREQVQTLEGLLRTALRTSASSSHSGAMARERADALQSEIAEIKWELSLRNAS